MKTTATWMEAATAAANVKAAGTSGHRRYVHRDAKRANRNARRENCYRSLHGVSQNLIAPAARTPGRHSFKFIQSFNCYLPRRVSRRRKESSALIFGNLCGVRLRPPQIAVAANKTAIFLIDNRYSVRL
jgi:hypothetical protein